MKKGVVIILGLILASILLFSLASVSANWFTDFWGKITGNVISAPTINPVVVASGGLGTWQLRAVGDINSDNIPDLFYQEPTGKVAAWIMNANGSMRTSVLLSGSATSTQIKTFLNIGSSNFIYFQEPSTGAIGYWTLDSSGMPATWTAVPNTQNIFKIVTAGRLNNQPVVLFEDASGNLAYWIVNSTGGPVSWNTQLNSAGGWRLAAAGIMNGATNLFFQDTSGSIAYWIMGPSGTFSSANSLQSASGWLLKAAAGNNIYFQSPTSTAVVYWTLNFGDSLQTCMDFTYAAWSVCSSGTQTRTVTASLPSGCTGGSPVLTQSCNSGAPDLTPPVMSNTQPTGTITSNAGNISVVTDETSTCKYSQDQTGWTTFFNTGGKSHSQTFASLPNGQNTFYVRCKDSFGNENQVSSIITFTIASSTPTCIDSDGGLNYYVKGFTNSSFYYSSGSWGHAKIDDVCINSTSLQEQACNAYDGLHSANIYNCPNECVDGACINSSKPIEPSPSCSENYKLDFTSFVTNNGIDEVTLKKYDGSWSKQVKAGDIVSLGNVELTILGIDRNTKTVDYSVTSPSIIDYTSINKSSIYVTVNTQPMRYGADYDYFVVSYCGNKTTKTQACSGLINSIKTPTSTDERHLSYNNSYSGSQWVKDKQEPYTEYYSSWDWNSPEYQEKQLNYYAVSYDIQVFDNKNIDLSEQISWNENSPVCKASSYWVDNKDNKYYICNWNIFNNQQDSNSNYKSNNREIFWYNDNVLVRMYIYWGDSLTDAQVQQLVQQKIGDLINNLQNNQRKYIDWQNFEIVYPAMNELSNTINSCGSDIQVSSKDNQNAWSCKTEPVICPEHGFQTKTCQRWNNEKRDYDTQTQQLDCSPGMCSGCYVPKWFGSNNNDNKCIPYGFRFGQQNGWTYEIKENNETGTLQEGDNHEFVITYIDANKVIILTAWNNASYTLQKGETVNLDLNGLNQAYILVAKMTVNDILYSSQDSSTNAVKVVFQITANQQTPSYLNAYCDIDGLIKEQKAKNAEGAWATCQNNYECRSNICSEGECIEALSMLKQAQAFVVKMLCRLSNPFSDTEYQSCVNQYSQ